MSGGPVSGGPVSGGGPVPAIAPGVQPPIGGGGTRALKVTQVIAGSAAARVGLQYGDILLSANGQPLQSDWQLKNAIHNSGGHLQLVVKCIRSGQATPMAITLHHQTPALATR